jgi:PncC family amidohydrolase
MLAKNTDKRLVELCSWFKDQDKTLSIAESCTGGLLSSLVTRLPGVSQFFRGSVVSYHADLKVQLLDVPLSTLKVMGEVNTQVALLMARGARKKMKSDWAVAITGVAGPSGGTVEKPVGFVCFAIVGPGFEEVKEKRFDPKDREKIQLESAEFAIDFLWDSVHE